MATSNLDEAILRILPTERDSEPWLATPEVHRRLEDRGHRVGYIRKVRRHLATLEKDNLVVSIENLRELLWQRKPWLEGTREAVSLMSASEAVAFHILQRFAGDKLPNAVTKDIEPLFKAAEIRLSREKDDSRRYRAWADKVDSVDGNFALRRPRSTRNFSRPSSRQRSSNGNCLCSTVPHTRPTHRTRLNRAPCGHWRSSSRAASCTWSRKIPPMLRGRGRQDEVAAHALSPGSHHLRRRIGRDLRLSGRLQVTCLYRRGTGFRLPAGTPALLELAFEGSAGNHLKDTPIAKDQKDETMPDGRLKITGMVVPSLKLRWWLRSLGSAVEVLAPQALRDDFARDYAQLAKRYGPMNG